MFHKMDAFVSHIKDNVTLNHRRPEANTNTRTGQRAQKIHEERKIQKKEKRDVATNQHQDKRLLIATTGTFLIRDFRCSCTTSKRWNDKAAGITAHLLTCSSTYLGNEHTLSKYAQLGPSMASMCVRVKGKC